MKYLIMVLLFIIIPSSANTTLSSEKMKCVRWRWTDNVYDRKVYCIEWVKKDCSRRLHERICKQE